MKEKRKKMKKIIFDVQLIFFIIMKNYFDQLPTKDKDYYSTILRVIGMDRMVNLAIQKKEPKRFTSEQMFQFCRFNDSSDYSPQTKQQISSYNQQETENSCLHIAAQYSNLPLIKYILANNLIKPQTTNKRKDNPLFHALKTSVHDNFQQTVLYLSKYTDLDCKDQEDKYSFQVDLALLTKSRVRVIQAIRQQFYKQISNRK